MFREILEKLLAFEVDTHLAAEPLGEDIQSLGEDTQLSRGLEEAELKSILLSSS